MFKYLGLKPNLNIEGQKQPLPNDYGGLGARYFHNLTNQLDKIHQVDTVTGVTETNGSVRGRAIMLALAMREFGVIENDIILISSRCHTEQTIVVLATLFLGAIVAPVDTELARREYTTMIGKLKPKMCFCDARAISLLERALVEMSMTSIIINFSKNSNDKISFMKLFTHHEQEDFCPVYIYAPKRAVAFIIATQGTVEEAKLVCLSHNNILLQTMIFNEILDYPKKVLSFFPLSWVLQAILTCVCFETSLVRILPGEFKERQACKLIHDYDIDFALLGTDFALRLVDDVGIKDYNINCLKNIMVGSVTTSKNNMAHFRIAMPKVNFIQSYALTETGFIAACSAKIYKSSFEKPGSVGRLLNNCKIRIVDLKTRESLGPNKFGEILFSGDGFMLGYFKDTQSTMDVMEKGFFKTGDIAEYDEDGWLYIQGRIDDLVTMDGKTFSPIPLEDVILVHPFIRDVVVIGNGEDLLACVLRKPDTNLSHDRLMGYLYTRLPEDLHPTKIVFMDDFPKTSAGKVKKRVLREEFFKVKVFQTESLSSFHL